MKTKFLVDDIVVVTNGKCCAGYDTGVTCRIIEVYPLESSDKGVAYALKPVDPSTKYAKAGLFSCDDCLDLIERIEENN